MRAEDGVRSAAVREAKIIPAISDLKELKLLPQAESIAQVLIPSSILSGLVHSSRHNDRFGGTRKIGKEILPRSCPHRPIAVYSDTLHVLVPASALLSFLSQSLFLALLQSHRAYGSR